MLKLIKEPVNSISHMIGAAAALPVTAALIYISLLKSTFVGAFSFFVFGLAMLALYGASSVYHGVKAGEHTTRVLKRIDHMMIFALIAGTYTPICLIPLKGAVGYALLAAIWLMAALGIVMKALWLDAPRWLSSGIYVMMGWAVVLAFYPLVKSMAAPPLVFLFLGGLAYTAGAVIYALKRPPLPFKNFGYHELFHIFVLCGSAFHIVLMFYILLD